MTARRISNWLATFACIVGLIVVNSASRDPADYRWYTGSVDDVVTSPMFDVEIHDVIAATEVTSGYTTLTTDHVFLIVEWEATAKERTARLGSGDVDLLLADGTLVRQRGDFLSTANLPAAAPGFTSTGVSVFEIPAEALADDAALEIRDRQGLFTNYSGALRIEGIIDDDLQQVGSVTLDPATVRARR